MLLRAWLVRQQYVVVEAANGQEAITVFEREQPDMVIMDVSMPVMNGYEAVPIIKAKSGQRFVPIIFLTGLDGDEALSKCIDSGGDDFVAKPIKEVVLKAKLHAMQRILQIYNEMHEYRQATEDELRLARHVFATITRRMKEFIPGLGFWTQSTGHLPGDMILYDTTPSGQIYAMVADFTGHGLSAAVGAIPVADIFFALTKKDFSLVDIAVEVNRKLRQIFPVGHFCSAAFVSSNPAAGRVKVLNAGLPDAFLVGKGREVIQHFPSRNLPLGIVDLKAADVVVETAQHALGSKLVVITDGLTEAMNRSEEAIGAEGLLNSIRSCTDLPLFEAIQHMVQQHTEGVKPHDDISLLVLPIKFSQELDIWEGRELARQ